MTTICESVKRFLLQKDLTNQMIERFAHGTLINALLYIDAYRPSRKEIEDYDNAFKLIMSDERFSDQKSFKSRLNLW